MSQQHPEIRTYGLVLPLVRAWARAISKPSRLILGSPFAVVFAPPEDRLQMRRQRARKVDLFLLSCMAIDLAWLTLIATLPGGLWTWLPTAWAIWRIMDIAANAINKSLLEELEAKHHHRIQTAPARVVILGTLNYLELAICFSCLYATRPDLIIAAHPEIRWVFSEAAEKALHLSLITQLTVGYGDLIPSGWVRFTTWLQSFMGLGVLTLLVGRFIAYLPHQVELEESRGPKRSAESSADQPDAAPPSASSATTF